MRFRYLGLDDPNMLGHPGDILWDGRDGVVVRFDGDQRPTTINPEHVDQLDAPLEHPHDAFADALQAGATCGECHAPGVVHKGHVMCVTRACPEYGYVIRPATAAEQQAA